MHVLNKKGDHWLYVRMASTGRNGLVPSEHVMKFRSLDERE